MTYRKKVILVYSTAGMGHKKAALAVESVIKSVGAGCEVKTVDIMEYASRAYRFLYLDFYVFLMKKAKWLWAFMFYVSDLRLFDILTRKIRSRMDQRGVPGFGDMLMKEDPDAVVATHFLVPSIACILRQRGLRSRIFAVVTDYGPHSYWLSGCVNTYFAGSEWVRSELIRKGISQEKVIVTGIPTTKEFREEQPREVLKKKYGLDDERKTVFIMSGGFGVGPVGKMLLEMKKCRTDIQVIAVCGHNKELRKQLEIVSFSLNYPVKLFGFTDKVAELMAISDIMITKAGGISVTEAMVTALPMIFYGSIPGQETWNEKFLTSAGAAVIARTIKDIPLLADSMLGSEVSYSGFKKSLSAVSKPDSAGDIAEEVLKSIGG